MTNFCKMINSNAKPIRRHNCRRGGGNMRKVNVVPGEVPTHVRVVYGSQQNLHIRAVVNYK